MVWQYILHVCFTTTKNGDHMLKLESKHKITTSYKSKNSNRKIPCNSVAVV